MKLLNIKVTNEFYPTPNTVEYKINLVGCDQVCENCIHGTGLSGETTDVTPKELLEKINELNSELGYIDNIVIGGGDSMWLGHAEEVIEFTRLAKLQKLNVCLYTGQSIDYLTMVYDMDVFDNCKFLIEGANISEFKLDKKRTSKQMVLTSSTKSIYEIKEIDGIIDIYLISDEGVLNFTENLFK